MEAAKSALREHLHHAGKEHTEVDEHVKPAVTSETVKPHQHEEITQAVDREVHQHHYHTTVQPLAHTETLPEKHTHNLVPVVQKEFSHGDQNEDKTRLATEAALFKDNTEVRETTHSASKAPTLVGEHVHHHVHETVQPVIHKETIQPEVVHTTIPIHEVHTSPAQHHGISTLPMKTLSDFEQAGGKISGGAHAHEQYEGEPRAYNPDMQKVQYEGAGIASSQGALQQSSSLNPEDTTLKRDIHSRDSGVSGVDSTTHGATATGAGAGAATAAATSHEVSSGHHGAESITHDSAAAGSNIESDVKSQTQHAPSDAPPVNTSQSNAEATDTDSGVARNTATETSTTEAQQLHEPSEAETRPTQKVQEDEPNNLTGGKAEIKDDKELDPEIQHGSQGEDPSLVKEKISKITGEGIDGSHSAVFGLTPDGHKFEDTKNHGSTGVPAPKEESEKKDDEEEKTDKHDTKDEVPASDKN